MEERDGTRVRNVTLDLLNQLRTAIGQLRLYPLASPQAQKALAPAHAALSAYPAPQGKITLARTLRGFLVNSQRLPAGDAAALVEKSWLQVLQDASVNSLTLRAAIPLPEFGAFLAFLVKKFWDLKDGKEINARLKAEGVAHAWVEEVQFVAMAKGDLLIEGAAGKLRAAGARVAEIVQTLEQVIDGTASEGLGEQVRLEIMRKLLDQDPTLVQKAQAMNFAVAEAPAGEGSELPGGRRTLFGGGHAPGWISFEQARKSLAEIARLLKRAEGADREALRALGHQLLGGFRYDPLLCELLKQFLSDEAIDLIPAWMLEEKKPQEPQGPAQRVPPLLALPEEARLDALAAEGVDLLKELRSRPELAADLVKALLEHAKHANAAHRLRAFRVAATWRPILEAAELRALDARCLEALDVERDRALHPLLADWAASEGERLLLAGELEAAARVLELLAKQRAADDKELPERRETAARALAKIAAGPALPALLDKLRAKEPNAARVAEALGPAAAPGIVERMKRSDNMAERMGLSQLLLRCGPEARAALSAEIQRVLAPSEALKLVDLLRLALSEDEAEAALAATLRHPVLAVRRRAAAYLKGRPSSRTGGYFLDALRQENDPAVRVLFIESLGALAYEPAYPALCQIFESRGESDEIRGAAAAALGGLGKPQAVALLSRVATKGRGLNLVLNPAPTPVRAAATRALGAFARLPEGRDALRRGLEDVDVLIRDAAREGLLAPIVKAFGEPARGAALLYDPETLERLPEGSFAGHLSDLPLDAICQALEEAGRSGDLRLHVGGSNALIQLDRGGVAGAEYNGLKGQEAFNQFCRWEGLYALFTPGADASGAPTRQSLIKMLMDACELRERADRPA